jgi:hypothetical protein
MNREQQILKRFSLKFLLFLVRFEVLMAVSMKMAVLVVASSSLVEVYRFFRGACCLCHCPDDGGSKHL